MPQKEIHNNTGYENFKKYIVSDVSSISEFCNRYYKDNRYNGRGKEYAACCLKSNIEHFNKYGYTFITHHDSRTGEVVSYYGDTFINDLIKSNISDYNAIFNIKEATQWINI